MFYKLIKQAGVLLGGNLLASILNFFSVAIAIKALGVASFGAVTLLQAYILVISLCASPQAWQGLIKFFSTEKDKTTIIKLTFRYDLICAVFGTLFALVFATPYVNAFHLYGYAELLQWCSLYVLINQTSIAIGVLRYNECYRSLAIQSVISAVLFFISALIGQWYSFEVKYFVISYFITLGFGVIYIQCKSYSYIKELLTQKVNKKNTLSSNKKTIYNRFNYAVHLTSLADIPVKQLDNILVGAVVSIEAAGAYRVIKQIATLSTKVTGPLNQVLYPEINTLLAARAFEKVKFAMVKLVGLLAVPSLVAVFFASISVNYWIPLVFTEGLLDYKLQIITFLVIHASATIFTPVHPVFLALGYVRELLYITLASNALLCVTIVLLGSQIELWGVLAAILLQYLLTIVLKLPLILKKLNLEANESSTLHT